MLETSEIPWMVISRKDEDAFRDVLTQFLEKIGGEYYNAKVHICTDRFMSNPLHLASGPRDIRFLYLPRCKNSKEYDLRLTHHNLSSVHV
jgi:hypothetical protein